MGLEALLDGMVGEGIVSCAVGWVGSSSERLWGAARGEAAPGEAASLGTLFDLASLTKPCVASLGLVLDGAGRLPLATRVGELWPEIGPPLSRRSLSSLLRHRGGWPAWWPIYELAGTQHEARSLFWRSGIDPAPPGTYSDLGYLLYGWSVEERLGRPLGTVLREELFAPLGLEGLCAPPGARAGVALCPLDSSREVLLAAAQGREIGLRSAPSRGEVQDGNARFLGGVCGHAGLFGTAEALWRLGCKWLRPTRPLAGESVSRARGGRGPFALGWRRRRISNSAGPALSPSSIGHVGFTGGSLWLDSDADRILVLLAHRSSVTVELASWRRHFHQLALAAFPPAR